MPPRRTDVQAYEAARKLLEKEEFDLWEQDPNTLTVKRKKDHRKLRNRVSQHLSRQKKEKQFDKPPGGKGGDENQAVAQNEEEIAPSTQSTTKKTPNRKEGTSPAVQQSCPSSRRPRTDPVAPINQVDGREEKKAVTTSKSKQPPKEEEQNSLSKTRGGGKWLPFKSTQPLTDEKEEEENRADSGGKPRPTKHPRTSHNSGTLANELVQLDPITALQASSSWNVSDDSIHNPAFARQSAAATPSVPRAPSDVFDPQIPPSLLLQQPPIYQFNQPSSLDSLPSNPVLNRDNQKPTTLSELTNQTLGQRQQQKALSAMQARQQQVIPLLQQNSHRVPFFVGHPTSAPASQNTEWLFCPTTSLPLQAPKLQSFPTNGSTLYRTSTVHIMPLPDTTATLPLDDGFSLPLQ